MITNKEILKLDKELISLELKSKNIIKKIKKLQSKCMHEYTWVGNVCAVDYFSCKKCGAEIDRE